MAVVWFDCFFTFVLRFWIPLVVLLVVGLDYENVVTSFPSTTTTTSTGWYQDRTEPIIALLATVKEQTPVVLNQEGNGKRLSRDMISKLKNHHHDSKTKNKKAATLDYFYQIHPQLLHLKNESTIDNETLDGRVVSTVMQLIEPMDAIVLLSRIIDYCCHQQNKQLLNHACKSFIRHVGPSLGPCWIWHTVLYQYPIIHPSNDDPSIELHHVMLSTLGSSRLDLIQLLLQWRSTSEKKTTRIPLQLWTNLFSSQEIHEYNSCMTINESISKYENHLHNTTTLPPIDEMSFKIAITTIARNLSKYGDEYHTTTMLVYSYFKQLLSFQKDKNKNTIPLSIYHLVLQVISKASTKQQQQKQQQQQNDYNYVELAMDVWFTIPDDDDSSYRYNHGTIDLMKSITYKKENNAWDEISTPKKNGMVKEQNQQQYMTHDLGEYFPKVSLPNEVFFQLGKWECNDNKKKMVVGIKPHRNPIQNGVTFVFYLCNKNSIGETKEENKQQQKVEVSNEKDYEKIAFILVRHTRTDSKENNNDVNNSNQKSEQDDFGVLTSLLMGMWIEPKFRGNGWATIFMAVWIQLCHKAGVSNIATEIINKPILALLLTKFGFTPNSSGGIEMEISPFHHLSCDEKKNEAARNGNDEAQSVLYSSQNVLLNGAFTKRDLRIQNLYIAQNPPSPRGTKIKLKTSYTLLHSSKEDEYKNFIHRIQTKFNEKTGNQSIQWSTSSDKLFQKGLFGYLLPNKTTN